MEERIKMCLNFSPESTVVEAAFLLYFSGHRLENRELFFCPLSQCPQIGGTKVGTDEVAYGLNQVTKTHYFSYFLAPLFPVGLSVFLSYVAENV